MKRVKVRAAHAATQAIRRERGRAVERTPEESLEVRVLLEGLDHDTHASGARIAVGGGEPAMRKGANAAGPALDQCNCLAGLQEWRL